MRQKPNTELFKLYQDELRLRLSKPQQKEIEKLGDELFLRPLPPGFFGDLDVTDK